MLYKFFLLAVLTARAAQAPDYTVMSWLTFLNQWQNFIREVYGCPEEVNSLDDPLCKKHEANVNMKKFNKARNTAKKVFDLAEK